MVSHRADWDLRLQGEISEGVWFMLNKPIEATVKHVNRYVVFSVVLTIFKIDIVIIAFVWRDNSVSRYIHCEPT